MKKEGWNKKEFKEKFNKGHAVVAAIGGSPRSDPQWLIECLDERDRIKIGPVQSDEEAKKDLEKFVRSDKASK